MKFLKLAFIYKNHDTLRYVTFLYTKRSTLLKKQDNLRNVFIQKSGTFELRDFSLNFWNLWRGGDINFWKKQCTLRDIFILKKQCTLRCVAIYKEPDTMRYILIVKKQYTFLYVYIFIIYRAVLIPKYKRTYDQSD